MAPRAIVDAKGQFTQYNFCLQLSQAMRLQPKLYNVNRLNEFRKYNT
jgi:hypothetical protein